MVKPKPYFNGGNLNLTLFLVKPNPKPSFNIPRRNEPVATYTVFSDRPAINDGSTMAQFLLRKDALVCDTYGIKIQKQFINTLYDNIKTRGAMDTVITDGGK